MRATTAFTLGVLSATGLGFLGFLSAPAQGGDPCAPGAVAQPAAPAGGAMPASPAAAEPAREKTIDQPFLLGLAGDWTCDCSFPTGQKAQGGASARLVMDGTALLTEALVDWKDKDGKSDPHHALGVWKVGADGTSLRYWGFSSHDSEVDMLVGTLGASQATVAGTTRWGPMRLTLALSKEGVLTQQLWINMKDMGTVAYTKAGQAPAADAPK